MVNVISRRLAWVTEKMVIEFPENSTWLGRNLCEFSFCHVEFEVPGGHSGGAGQ